MPQTQTGSHPSGRSITFEEESHSYIDDRGEFYRSFTTLIHDYFPQFDAAGTAARIARKRGKSAEELVREWNENSENACRYGTRVHENCEFRMKGMPQPNQPENEQEEAVFAYAEQVVDYLKERYSFIAAEKILFSPRCLVAGTVDLMMSEGNTLWIIDYKTNKKIKTNGFGMGFHPLEHLVNCNFEHYSMQLSLAEVVAKTERYIPINTVCRRALVHFPPDAEPQWIETPDRTNECYQMLIDRVSKCNDIPF